MTTSARIAEARKRRGFTQRQLADAMAVSVQAVSQWETGKNAIAGTRIMELAGILRVSAAWLLSGTEKQEAFDDASAENVPIVSLIAISDMYHGELDTDLRWTEFVPVTKDTAQQKLAYRIHVKPFVEGFQLADVLIFQLREEAIDGDIVFAAVKIDKGEKVGTHTFDYKMSIFEFFNDSMAVDGKPGLYLRPLMEKDSEIYCLKNAATVMAVMIEQRRFRTPRRR